MCFKNTPVTELLKKVTLFLNLLLLLIIPNNIYKLIISTVEKWKIKNCLVVLLHYYFLGELLPSILFKDQRL